MSRLRLGVRLESLGLPFRAALEEAARLGVGGVQVDAVGELSPNHLSQTGRRGFLHLLHSHDLELTALGCPLRHGLAVREGQQARIEHVQRVLSLSYELGPRKVVLHAGQFPEDPADVFASPLREALLAIAHHGDRVGAQAAVETGSEPGSVLARYLRTFDTGGLRVNLDPANLMINGFDPYEPISALAGLIVHVHAKEARLAGVNRAAQEVPLGQGDLDWYRFLGALEEAGYTGWLTIEREFGSDRRRDVAEGVRFLRRLVGAD